MSIAPTPQQRAAITTLDRALLVDAGAGTGKTRVLTERFLHLLETYPDWSLESIVAVTFTEKAAREMRSRIRDAIEAKALEASALPHWREHRRNLNRLRVSTIHSLCSRLLRENAIAAGVDPRFEMLDERTVPLLQEEAMENVFGAMVDDDDPGLALLAALRVTDLREEMAGLLSLRGTVNRLFGGLEDKESLLARWQIEVEEMFQAVWLETLETDPNLAEALEYFPLTRDDLSPKQAAALGTANTGVDLYQQGDLRSAVETFAGISLWGGRTRADLVEFKEMLRALQGAGKALLDFSTLVVGEADEHAADLLQLWRALWERVNGEYDRLKDARHALDFDDLLMLTARLLADQQDDPRLQVYRAGINHLMVDEFQDTNLVQTRIVNALASPEEGGRLFVVGDAKQSIYRFLQAQVSVFNGARRDIESANGAILPLNRSFRSHKTLVKALNRLFDRVLGAAREDYEAPPGALEADRKSRENHPPPVELLVLPKKDHNEERVNVETARRWEAKLLAERLIELERDEFPVWDKELDDYRPFQYGDAAVLLRALSDIGLYEEAFKAAGLPYLTISGRGYYDRPEVRDLTALLMCLYNPADDLNLAAALRSPLFGFSDETLYRLRWPAPDKLMAYRDALNSPPDTDQPGAVRFAAETMEALWPMVGRVSVWRLLREALDRTGYEAALTLDDKATGERQLNNVRKFMALARDAGEASLPDFLRMVEDSQAREVREGEASGDAQEAGAVQVMTVHAAKGLEFPVVAVADMGREMHSKTSRILHDPLFGLVCKQRDENGDWQEPASFAWGKWLNKQLEIAEHKRLFYVACTRAADLLLLSGFTTGHFLKRVEAHR